MKVTLLQLDSQWASPQENILRAQRLMDQQPNSDLYVLPEMWATGFATEPQEIAEDEKQSLALSWMCQTARERHCALCGSLAIATPDGRFRNRHYFVHPSGEVCFYDKHHLFTYGHEDRYYTAGDTHTSVDFMGFRILLLTCYDARFPVWSRYGKAGEYDVIVYVANWPQSRQSAWQILMRARAIENQCFVVAVNRVGDDSFSHYVGNSAVIDGRGRTLIRGRYDEECAVSCELQKETLTTMRQRFRVLDDRDLF